MTVSVQSNDRQVPQERLEAAAEEGRRLAAQGLPAPHAYSTGDPVEALARSGIARLRDAGVTSEVVRARRGCLVVRTVPRVEGYEAEACALVHAWLGALPAAVYGAPGTVAESSCGARGGRSCMHTVMWQAPAGTGRVPLDPPEVEASAPGAPPPVPPPPVPPAVPPPPVPAPRVAPPPPVAGVALAPMGLRTASVPASPPGPLFSAASAQRAPGTTGNTGAEDPVGPRDPAAPESEPAAAKSALVRGGRRQPWIRRRAWLVAIGLLAGCLGGFYASSKAATAYSATSVLVVQANGATAATSSANGAEALAVTYAALIPDDQSLLHRVAAELGVSPTSIAHSLTVQSEAGTALVDIHFSAEDPATAQRGANDVARLLSSANPPGRAIAARSVATVSSADAASRTGTLHKYGLPLGVLGGLVVGAGAALVAERTDRRVDDLSALGGVSDCLATVVPGGLTAAELACSLERSGEGPVTVVPIRAEQHESARALASSVRETWPVANGSSADGPIADGATPSDQVVPEILVSPPYFDAPRAMSPDTGRTVLVVGAGERAVAVREVIERLRLLGRGPIWAVLDRAGGSRASGRAR